MEFEIKRQLVELARNRRDGVSDQKGQEYTKTGKEYKQGGDILANFKRNAERFGQSPFTVLGVYMGKHFDSIENFIKELATMESYEDAVNLALSGEGIVSRIDDAANYLDLLEALLFEYELHPYALLGGDSEASIPIEVEAEEEALDMPSDEQMSLEEEVAAAAAVELADLVPSPFKGSREVGNG